MEGLPLHRTQECIRGIKIVKCNLLIVQDFCKKQFRDNIIGGEGQSSVCSVGTLITVRIAVSLTSIRTTLFRMRMRTTGLV